MERLMDGRLKWCYSQLLSVLLLFKLMLSRDNPTGHGDEHEVDIRHNKLCVWKDEQSWKKYLDGVLQGNWVTYLPTLSRFFQETHVFHCSLLISFRCHNSPAFLLIYDNFHTFFPILVFTSCFWLCTACSLLESCTSSTSVSEKEILRKMWDILKGELPCLMESF